MAMSKVVIGYDPSDRGERAFATGVEIARALGAEIHVVTAFDDGPKAAVEITPQRRAAETTLEKVAARTELAAARVRVHAVPGKPADVIVEVARDVHADVIVIGNRGAQGAARVLGSVANAVMAHAPCDVLVVKTR
jgi:nucleotide-binding universal stress UspA family protein